MGDFLSNWQDVNNLTTDFLNKIPEEDFYKKPFGKRFKSFAWEFACILSTREGYLRGFALGKLDGNCFSSDKEFSKKEFLKRLDATNKKIIKLMKAEKVVNTNYFGDKTSKETVLSWLMQHEQMHYGKLVLYFAQAGISLPDSLVRMWGKSFRK